MRSFDELLDILDRPGIDKDIAFDLGRLEPELSLDDAYRLQLASKARRVARGDRIAGHQASFTSAAIRKSFPDFPAPMTGTILASLVREDGAVVELDSDVTFIENEVCVLMSRDLAGPGVTAAAVLGAIEGYLPAIEVGPLRPGILEAKWSHQHMIAQQKADGGYIVIGQKLTSPHDIDIRFEGVVVSVNGELRSSAAAIETMGSPLNAVAAIANRLGRYGESLRAGQIVMTGSIAAPGRVVPGDRDARVEFTRLGSVSVRFAPLAAGSSSR